MTRKSREQWGRAVDSRNWFSIPTSRPPSLGDTIGAKEIVEGLETYESLSPRFKAPQMLIQLARDG